MSKPQTKVTDFCGNELTVRPTFPYNPDSKTSPGTARRWAEAGLRRYDRIAGCVVTQDPTEIMFVERDNEPFNVKIIDLDVRSEGGRAYKVVDHEDRTFDLREDQLIEVMTLRGINAGGDVPGQFVWGVVGSQVRLTLVGGELHTEMIKHAEEQKISASSPQITKRDLTQGHIYKRRDEALMLFLGRVRVSGKLMYAFCELPRPPHVWRESAERAQDPYEVEPPRVKHERLEREVAAKWADMSWIERCQWEWYDSHEYQHALYPEVGPGYYYHPGPLVIMSSLPKFAAELDDTAFELAQQVVTNVDAAHCYINGNGDDLAESVDETSSGISNAGNWYDQQWPRRSDEQRRDDERKEKDRCQAQRVRFRDSLVWT